MPQTMSRCLAGIFWVMTLQVGPATAEALNRQETPAERGYRLLRTKPYMGGDVDKELFEDLWQVWPPEQRAEAEKKSPMERKQWIEKRYGIVPPAESDPFRGNGDALGYITTSAGRLVNNCFTCHAGKVAGIPMPGLGNSHIALQTLSEDISRLRRQRGQNVWANVVSSLYAPLGASNGTTNAQIFSVLLVALRDDQLNRTRPARMPSVLHADLDAPPLWNTHKKKRLYIDGFVEKTPRVLMQFVLVAENDGALVRSWEPDFEDILAYIESLRPPKYPWEIRAPLAKKGREIFRDHCASCHGNYGALSHYPEKRVPIEEVGTDRRRLDGVPVSHRQFFARGWMGESGRRKVVERPDGYVAPPLDGVWASAPYLHNGSIPTLWHLLHTTKRPALWRRSVDGYDRAKVGLEVETFSSYPDDVRSPAGRREFFDTRLPGKSNAGHEFPESLTEEDKSALLEYLKSL